eukprot:g29799.t1
MQKSLDVGVEELLKWLALTAVFLVFFSIIFLILKLRRSYERASSPAESKIQHTPRTAEEYNEWLQENYKAPAARRAADDLVLPIYFSYLKAQCVFFTVLCGMGLILAFTNSAAFRHRTEYLQVPAALLVAVHAMLCDGIEIFFLHKGVGDGPLHRTYWFSAMWGCLNGLIVLLASLGVMSHDSYSLWMPVMFRCFSIFFLNALIRIRISIGELLLYLKNTWGFEGLWQCPLRRAHSLRQLVNYNVFFTGLAILLWSVENFVDHEAFVTLDFVLILNLFVYFVAYILVLVRALQRDSQMWRDFGVTVESQANPAMQPLLGGVLINLDFSRLHYGHVINSGTFATVFRGTYKSDKGYIIPVAIKAMRCFQLDQELISDFCAETNALLHLEHRNVVMLFGVCVDPPRLAIVMELCQNGSLEDRIEAHVRRNTQFHLVSVLRYAVQLAEAVAFMHEKGVLHRDLKPANILFALKGGVLKLCDLGLASSRERLDGNKLFLGTPEYMAPELHALRNRRDPATVTLQCIIDRAMLMDKDGHAPSTDQILAVLAEHNIKCVDNLTGIEPGPFEEALNAIETTPKWRQDIRAALMPYVADLDYGADAWAFGIILWQLCCTKRAPWLGMKEMAIKKAVLRGDRPVVPDTVEPELRKLINRCLSYHRQLRPGFAEIQFKLHQLEIQLADESMSEVMESSWGTQPHPPSLVEPFVREDSDVLAIDGANASQQIVPGVIQVRGSLQGLEMKYASSVCEAPSPGDMSIMSSAGSSKCGQVSSKSRRTTPNRRGSHTSLVDDEAAAAAMFGGHHNALRMPAREPPRTFADMVRSIVIPRPNKSHRSSYQDRSQLIARPPGTLQPGTPRRPSDPPRLSITTATPPARSSKSNSKEEFPEVGNAKDPSKSHSDFGGSKSTSSNSTSSSSAAKEPGQYGSLSHFPSPEPEYNPLLSISTVRRSLDADTILKVQSAEAIGEHDSPSTSNSPPSSPKMQISKSAPPAVSPFKMWPAGAVTVYTTPVAMPATSTSHHIGKAKVSSKLGEFATRALPDLLTFVVESSWYDVAVLAHQSGLCLPD